MRPAVIYKSVYSWYHGSQAESVASASRARLLHLLLFLIGSVLSRDGIFVVHEFGKLVIAGSYQSPQQGADPVDPMMARPVAGDAVNTEGAGWVEGTASVVDTWMRGISIDFGSRNSGHIPANSQTKSARPMPTGAMNVALFFSAASMRTVMVNMAVKNISMNKPCATEVP